jgi:TDG/mug DNA glycosylase family protein
MRPGAAPEPTLPDLLAPGLDVLFVGINPSIYAAERGHYFARPTNRFWPCFSRSVLSRAARDGLGAAMLRPTDDRALIAFGIGFTDVVKRATVRASDVPPSELAAGVAALLAKIEQFRPRIACFHGVTGYRFVHRILAPADGSPALGLQPHSVGATRIYLVPNPSGANAHVTPAEQTRWYDRLAALTGR